MNVIKSITSCIDSPVYFDTASLIHYDSMLDVFNATRILSTVTIESTDLFLGDSLFAETRNSTYFFVNEF